MLTSNTKLIILTSKILHLEIPTPELSTLNYKPLISILIMRTKIRLYSSEP
jgi:hypothetical protein